MTAAILSAYPSGIISTASASLYMLSDYAGIEVPCFLLLNMSDVAKGQGKDINAKAMEDKLGIPVVLFSAPEVKKYDPFYNALERAVSEKTVLSTDSLEEKYNSIPEYTEIKSIIGDIKDGNRTGMWLAVKALEGDLPVTAKIKAEL